MLLLAIVRSGGLAFQRYAREFALNKFLVGALAAASCVLGASSASALVITISEGGVVVASWEQLVNPVPIAFVDGEYTKVAVTNSFGLGGDNFIIWYSAAKGGGLSSFDGGLNIVGGQNFTNPGPFLPPESMPVFLTGAYSGTDIPVSGPGIAADVSISVPEPATWATMLVGLGMIGFAARRRRNISVTYA